MKALGTAGLTLLGSAVGRNDVLRSMPTQAVVPPVVDANQVVVNAGLSESMALLLTGEVRIWCSPASPPPDMPAATARPLNTDGHDLFVGAQVRSSAPTSLVPNARPAPDVGARDPRAAGVGVPWVREPGEVDSLRGLIADLRSSGVQKVFIGESHGQSLNAFVIAEVLAGAADAGGETAFHRESFVAPNAHEQFENRLSKKEPKALDDIDLVIAAKRGTRDPDMIAGLRFFRKTVQQGNVVIRVMDFGNPSRSDMTRFIKEEGFAVASVGQNHVTCRATGSGVVLDCGPRGHDSDTNGRRAKMYGKLSPKKFAELYNGGARLRASGKLSILVLSSELWSFYSRGAYQRDFNEQGLVVLETRLAKFLNVGPSKPGNVTLVADKSMLPILQKFAEKNQIDSYLLCEGIKGCEPPKHGEHSDL